MANLASLLSTINSDDFIPISINYDNKLVRSPLCRGCVKPCQYDKPFMSAAKADDKGRPLLKCNSVVSGSAIERYRQHNDLIRQSRFTEYSEAYKKYKDAALSFVKNHKKSVNSEV